MSRRAAVLFALMSVIWGIPYLFIRVAVGEISPAVLVFARTAIGAAILLPVALARVDLRPVLARWRWVVAFAAAEVAIPWLALSSAEQRVSSSLAALLVAGVPLVGTVVGVLTRSRDHIDRRAILGLLLGILGVAAIVGLDLHAKDLAALVELAVVVVGYAVGPAILARRLAGLPGVAVMALSLALCAVVYAPIALLEWPAAVPSTEVLASIAVLGIVCTAAAFVLFSALVEATGPVRATVITYVNPAVASALGVAALGESFTPGMGLGFVLVIVGSVLATRPTGAPIRRRHEATRTDPGPALDEPAA